MAQKKKYRVILLRNTEWTKGWTMDNPIKQKFHIGDHVTSEEIRQFVKKNKDEKYVITEIGREIIVSDRTRRTWMEVRML